MYLYIYIYIFIYIYIYVYMYMYTYIYHLINGFSKNNIGRVHYSEFHVLNIHQVYISTSSKRKTNILIKQNNIKYTNN